jgi:NAD(P)-dependent dehydrogenase (short-subunit alcohol dehydrogenase family)
MSVVLIIGGVGGVGEALARRIRATGQACVTTSRSLDKTAALAQQIGAHACAVDAGNQQSIKEAVALAAGLGPLTGLAYCAGSIPMQPLARVTSDDMMAAYQLNVVGAMLAAQAAAPHLKAGKGSVVLFSSIAARQGFANHVAIGSAKAGVEGLTVALAAELSPDVRVNAIAPSLTVTPIAQALTSNARLAETIAAMHPIPRLGTADEMAALAAFLLSPEAGWITGQVVPVDGGRSSVRTGRS